MVMTFVPLGAMLVACVVGRGVRLFAGIFAIIYPITLLLWPMATVGGTADPAAEPWIWYLVNVATVASVLAFPLYLQIAWTASIPLLFGVVRLMQAGFERDYWYSVTLDVSFALILGGMLTTLGWVFRSVAANVDETRARAVESYAAAAAADAAEQERIAVAALMHDSVLAALIAAERAAHAARAHPRGRDGAGGAHPAGQHGAGLRRGQRRAAGCREPRRRHRTGRRSSSAFGSIVERDIEPATPRDAGAGRARARARGDAGDRQRRAARGRLRPGGDRATAAPHRLARASRSATPATASTSDRVPRRSARHPGIDLRARRGRRRHE